MIIQGVLGDERHTVVSNPGPERHKGALVWPSPCVQALGQLWLSGKMIQAQELQGQGGRRPSSRSGGSGAEASRAGCPEMLSHQP